MKQMSKEKYDLRKGDITDNGHTMMLFDIKAALNRGDKAIKKLKSLESSTSKVGELEKAIRRIQKMSCVKSVETDGETITVIIDAGEQKSYPKNTEQLDQWERLNECVVYQDPTHKFPLLDDLSYLIRFHRAWKTIENSKSDTLYWFDVHGYKFRFGTSKVRERFCETFQELIVQTRKLVGVQYIN